MTTAGGKIVHQAQQTTVDFRERAVDATALSVTEVADACGELMVGSHVSFVRNFPIDPDSFLEFLGEFGTPLANYSSRSDLEKSDPHPQINRVKYKRREDTTKQSVHYVAGGLRPHSARSWYSPRPRFFAMLMVEPGWRDTPPGERGESLVLGWHAMFNELAAQDGDVFEEHFARLSDTPITFQANNVRETLCDSPLLYPLDDASGPHDMGVRLKQDLGEKVLTIQDQIPDFPRYRESLQYLLDASNEEQFQTVFPMDSGDLVMVDNNRFAHGRRKIVGERTVEGRIETNNRELWSVTVE
jgi:alpha-ketoglutarate-dependent taurine dioxygenase